MLAEQRTENEERKYEVIGGTAYMMGRQNADHASVSRNISGIFYTYLKGKRCKVFSEFDVILDEENTFIPDVIINCDASKVHQDGIHGAPDLVVEILSRSTLKRDRTVKKDAYEKAGVKEYWIVSPNDKTIEVYRLQNGKFYLDKAVGVVPDWEMKRLTEQERAEVEFSFKVSLYDDFFVQVEDVFEGVE